MINLFTQDIEGAYEEERTNLTGGFGCSRSTRGEWIGWKLERH
jgi:hypothetical protein